MAELITREPLAAYDFHVWIGEKEFGFARVSGLARESEPFTYQEGGVNDRVHLLPGPVKNSGTLRLERGVYAGELFPFYLVGERLKAAARLEIWGEANAAAAGKIYTLTGLVVKKFEVGEMDAMQNALLIDRFELGYEAMRVAAK